MRVLTASSLLAKPALVNVIIIKLLTIIIINPINQYLKAVSILVEKFLLKKFLKSFSIFFLYAKKRINMNTISDVNNKIILFELLILSKFMLNMEKRIDGKVSKRNVNDKVLKRVNIFFLISFCFIVSRT